MPEFGITWGDAATAADVGLKAWSMLTSLTPKLHEKKSSAIIIALESGTDEPLWPGLRFQYYPESINDTKAVNYAQKAVPGGSLPLYQWINGGERQITFTAMFSSDIDLSLESKAAWGGTLAEETKKLGVEDRNVDIRAALTWLRSLMMPTYDSFGRTFPPPKMLLSLPNTGIGLLGGGLPGQSPDGSHHVLCIMTQCDIELKKLFPSGMPRLASVQLGFSQVAQRNGQVVFPGVHYPGRWMEKAYEEGIGTSGGYNLRPK
jgi:hypothetical protein